MKNLGIGLTVILLISLVAFFAVNRADNEHHPDDVNVTAGYTALVKESKKPIIAPTPAPAPDRTPSTRWKNKPLKIPKLKKLFENSVIVGNSMVEAVSDYSILYKNEAVFTRGISVCSARENVVKAVGMQPHNIFMVFGTNDLTMYRGNAKKFISDYAKQIRYIQKHSPQCNIFVNSINPIQKKVIVKVPLYGKQPVFNEALKKMCERMGIHYVDSTPILTSDKSLFEPDGIHPTYSYYPKWLTLLACEAGMI